MKETIVILTLSFSLSSCVETLNSVAGIGNVSATTSNFDGEKILELSPCFISAAGGVGASPVTLGAKYAPSLGKDLILTVNLNTFKPTYFNIKTLDVNINGRKLRFQAQTLTRFDPNYVSANGFHVPISVIGEMIAAKDCRIRVGTLDTDFEAVFHVEKAGGSIFAKHYFRNFINTI